MSKALEPRPGRRLSPATNRALLEATEWLELLAPGRYRLLLTVAKLRQRRGREALDGLATHAVDVTIRKPRLAAARAPRALPPRP